MLPTIVAFYHQYLSVSSPLLLRISPPHICLYSLSGSDLSSRNCSIYEGLRYIIPYFAPVYQSPIYCTTDLPWHTKSTFIIIFFSVSSDFLIHYIVISKPRLNVSPYCPIVTVSDLSIASLVMPSNAPGFISFPGFQVGSAALAAS